MGLQLYCHHGIKYQHFSTVVLQLLHDHDSPEVKRPLTVTTKPKIISETNPTL